ncbi:MAG: isoprenylcysteine carboxylmethyltransferase family protein [Candidatus Acidiferrales bacterium]
MGIFLPLQRDPWAEMAAIFVVASWLAYGVVFLVGRSRGTESHVARETRSHLGFGLQILAYAGCCVFSRAFFSPIMPLPRTAQAVVAAFTAVIAVAALALCFWAAWALEKQWALVARVIEGHELIERGPYAMVRNPIYLAMFGTLLATGLALCRWEALPVFIVVFLAGTEIRIRSEEKLLRDAFGARFADYARRVPALFPRVPFRSSR